MSFLVAFLTISPSQIYQSLLTRLALLTRLTRHVRLA